MFLYGFHTTSIERYALKVTTICRRSSSGLLLEATMEWTNYGPHSSNCSDIGDKWECNLAVRMLSDIKCTSICSMWPAHYISMSLAYVGAWDRGEVAALVSCSITCLGFTREQNGPCDWQSFQVSGTRGSSASRRSDSERDSFFQLPKSVKIKCVYTVYI
jgi:hypothetical protein